MAGSQAGGGHSGRKGPRQGRPLSVVQGCKARDCRGRNQFAEALLCFTEDLGLCCQTLEPGSDTEFVSLEGTSDSGEVSGLYEQEVKGHASDPAFAAPTWTSVCSLCPRGLSMLCQLPVLPLCLVPGI